MYIYKLKFHNSWDGNDRVVFVTASTDSKAIKEGKSYVVERMTMSPAFSVGRSKYVSLVELAKLGRVITAT